MNINEDLSPKCIRETGWNKKYWGGEGEVLFQETITNWFEIRLTCSKGGSSPMVPKAPYFFFVPELIPSLLLSSQYDIAT